MTKAHWRWSELSPSLWEIKRGKEKIGTAVKRGKVWRATATHEGVTGEGTSKFPENSIIRALRDMVNKRAEARGVSRSAELARHDKRLLLIMAQPKRRRR